MPLLFVLLLLPSIALAQGPEVNWSSWALSSLLVIALILVLGWLLRRLRGAALLGGSRQLKVVSSLALGQRERLMVVQVGEEQWLLGVTPQQISSLGKLDTPLAPEQASRLVRQRNKGVLDEAP
ncbi:flagellar biosynthetic protein FliO [Oceanisphaera pacifica]|uniref:Flagellar protein n=1 Tax=Oceanisphaera pacifica TaxID=2818389 RepID=A0ABS3NFX0_9GAMM|nr:flagellar biosynthetic protein FliO [Oceanisphaera pacifica]MBO1519181.1 flagellar biosynthetic protein FliO [Oceanisphaera pacifica]